MNEYYDFLDYNFNTDNTSNMSTDQDERIMNMYTTSYDNNEKLMGQQEIFPQSVQNPAVSNSFSNMLNNSVQENCGMYTPEQGLMRGNMFPTLFDPYKKWPLRKLEGKTDQETMLLNIQALDFAMKDINLYLDVHPNDSCMIRKFNEYLNNQNQLLNEYQQRFGPITLSISNRSLNNIPWAWNNTRVPWERGM